LVLYIYEIFNLEDYTDRTLGEGLPVAKVFEGTITHLVSACFSLRLPNGREYAFKGTPASVVDDVKVGDSVIVKAENIGHIAGAKVLGYTAVKVDRVELGSD
jgi:hypothetical protein